jgi:hypothetical protein
MLNDLFGVQARGGCSCAGPYGHHLLGIDVDLSREYRREIAAGCDGIKPGWVRVNLNYFVSEAVFRYVVEAVHLVAELGHRLLPDYRFDPATGLWRHRDGPVEPPVRLHQVRYGDDGAMRFPSVHESAPESALTGYLEQARVLLDARPDPGPDDDATGVLGWDFEHLRWFDLPRQSLGATPVAAR